MSDKSDSLPQDDGDDFYDLMRRVREGSEDAAWEIVRKYGGYIQRAVRRVLSQKLRPKFDSLDFVQLVWKSFFRMRKQADRFQGPQHLAKFLAGMANKKVQMENHNRLKLQQHNLDREVPLNRSLGEEGTEISSREPGPEDVAIAHEKWERLLKGQPAKYRRIIRLKLQGHTNVEIANMLGMDKQSVHRFLKRLLRATIV